MANTKTAMKKIKDILRLSEAGITSGRRIEAATGVSKPVVYKLLKIAAHKGITLEQIQALDDLAVEALFYAPHSRLDAVRHGTLTECFPRFSQELLRPGVTRKLLWLEYRERFPASYGYTEFCKKFHLWEAAQDVSAPLEHRPGEMLFVDFAGDKFTIRDGLTGEERAVPIFVATLPASLLIFATACEGEDLRNVIIAGNATLKYFGGASEIVVPDNMKTAVARPDRYESEPNPIFGQWAEHHGMAVLPARVRKPKDKALVENAVQQVQRWILAPLRDQIFHSVDELNLAIGERLELLNQRQMSRYRLSRVELFSQHEKTALKPLPSEPFAWREHARVRVAFNAHVWLTVDAHYYSVPYRLHREAVDVYYTEKHVEIFHQGKRVALHARYPRGSERYTTKLEHMCPKHRGLAEWTPQRFLDWAESKGEAVAEMIKGVLERGSHPAQNYRTCLGILALDKRFGPERLGAACQRALAHGAKNYLTVLSILEKGLDQEPIAVQTYLPLPLHRNLRGSTYFRPQLSHTQEVTNECSDEG